MIDNLAKRIEILTSVAGFSRLQHFCNFAAAMETGHFRYQHNPLLVDTTGFFAHCIPVTNEGIMPTNDSLSVFYHTGIFDYIDPAYEKNHLNQVPSVFTSHYLAVRQFAPRPVTRPPADWITMLLIACLLIFAWIQNNHAKRFRQIFHAAAQNYYVNQLEREGNLFRDRITPGLNFIYFSTLSLFIFEICKEFYFIPFSFNNYEFTGLIFAGIILFYLLKSGLIRLLGIIFKTGSAARAYQLNSLIFNHVLGAILFPLIMVASFGESRVFLVSSIIFTLLLITYKLYRGILTGLANRRYSLFYLFLYLCTLEILPFLLLVKVISGL